MKELASSIERRDSEEKHTFPFHCSRGMAHHQSHNHTPQIEYWKVWIAVVVDADVDSVDDVAVVVVVAEDCY